MLSPEQLQERRKYIGSSESASLLGLNPYESPSDLWMKKTGRVADVANDEAIEFGNMLEPVLVRWACKTLGISECERDVMLTRGVMCANLDARIVLAADARRAIVEAKYSTLMGEWGAPMTDEVPPRVTIQTQHQMRVGGEEYATAYVPLLPGTFRPFPKLYVVNRDDSIGRIIEDACGDFWEKHVKADTPPTSFRPSLEVLKRVRREPGKTADVPLELFEADVVAQAAAKQAADDAKATREALLTALADAEAGRLPDGRVFTYLSYHNKGYTVEPFDYRKFQAPKKSKAARPALVSA